MPGAADLATALAALRAVDVRCFDATDDELVSDAEVVEQLGRMVDGLRLAHAAELEHRSRPILGTDRLSFRQGTRDGVELVQRVTRTSHHEAARRVGLGSAIAPRHGLLNEALPGRLPAVTDAVMSGAIGSDAARMIVQAWKRIRFRADPDGLTTMIDSLVETATKADLDTLHDAVGYWSLALDPDGAEPADRTRRRKRALRIGGTLEDGTTAVALVMLPEHLAVLKELLQSRRRNAPLVRTEAGSGNPDEPLEPEWREEPDPEADDPRSRPQQDYDTVVDALGLAVRAEAAGFEGATTTHQVIVTITADEVEARKGAAWAPGIMAGLPVLTVEQLTCTAEIRLQVDGPNGEPLFLSRAHRLFSPAQKLALVVAAGGRCEYPDCRVPHPYLEAHHVAWYHRDAGETHVDNGMMLCSYHHHLIHAPDSPVEIRRHDGDLFIVPKAWTSDPDPDSDPVRRRDRRRPPGRLRRTRDPWLGTPFNPAVFGPPVTPRH